MLLGENKTISRQYERLDVQGLRGIAVLLVVLFHAGLPIPGGFVGVDIFFVISGYVITSSLLRNFNSEGDIKDQLQYFYFRRMKRLIPALGTLILGVAIGSIFIESSWGEQQRTSLAGIASSLSFSNIYYAFNDNGYFSLAAQTNPFLHIWSLSIEEQFYLIFPLMLFYFLRGENGMKRTKFAVITFATLSLLFCINLGYGLRPFENFDNGAKLAFYLPITRSWEFLVGVCIALPMIRIVWFDSARRWLLQLTAFVALTYSALYMDTWKVFPGYGAVIPVTATALLLIVPSTQHRNLSDRFLQGKALVGIGNISYSWYLWHWPFIVFGQRMWPEIPHIRLLAAISSVLPAVLSYYWIEKHWREGTSATKNTALKIVFLFVLIPLFVSTSLFLLSNRESRGINTANQDDPSRSTGLFCNYVEVSCFAKDIDSNRQVMLAGDSHAGALYPLFEAVTNQLNIGLSVVSRPGCPFLDIESAFYLYNFEKQNLMTITDCNSSFNEGLEWLSQRSIYATIFVSNAPLYIGDPSLDSSFDLRLSCFINELKSCVRSKNFDERIHQYESLLQNSIDKVLISSEHVILVAPLPYQFREPENFVNDSILQLGTPRSAIDKTRDAVLQVYRKLALQNNRVTVWDPINEICNSEICPSSSDGQSNYTDNSHLSLHGSFPLRESLLQLLVAK